MIAATILTRTSGTNVVSVFLVIQSKDRTQRDFPNYYFFATLVLMQNDTPLRGEILSRTSFLLSFSHVLNNMTRNHFSMDCRLFCDAESRTCDPETEFTCEKNKALGRPQCISLSHVCDGDADCVDGADENSSLPNCPKPEPCNEDQFQCANGRCIFKGWLCDHADDCLDGSDETKSCAYRKCNETEFACENSKCIRKTHRCDGDNDCGDGSDERNCGNYLFFICVLTPSLIL